jgi:hypothetical protein
MTSLTKFIVQIIGYLCRALAHSNKENIPIYSVGTIMILLAPPLYAASIYMTLGRLIMHLDAERLSLVPVKWLTTIFVTGDVIAFVMQAAGNYPYRLRHSVARCKLIMKSGGGIMASGTISAMTTGEHITIGGLAVQLVFFSIFIIASSIFHYRVRKFPTEKSLSLSRTATWETVMGGLYIASILILIRSIFRLIEYAQGNNGYLISHEVFMYVFDSMLMFFTMVAMSIFHPSKVLSRPSKSRRSSEKPHSDNTELFSSTDV